VRVAIVAPGEETPVSVTLDGEGPFLIGRAPDVTALSEENAAQASAPPQCVALDSPNVSANHVLVTCNQETVSLVDLGSRNGTWLRLQPSRTLTVSGGDDLSLQLAMASARSPVDAQPEDAVWSGPSDFSKALGWRIEQWLGARDMPAEVTLIDRTDTDADRLGVIPLASGSYMLVVPRRTMDEHWVGALAQIERYVARQNVLFEAEETMRQDGLIVASRPMREAVSRVIDAAARGVRSLLIVGPSGAGKEGLARCFHRHAGRSGPFVAKNCATLTREFLRSELFGAEKGAFTGAVQRIVGAVETANEGTLLLDEIGELPAEVQPMLLRFLDRGEFERMGHRGLPSRADVLVLGATNRDLRGAALRGDFRKDLWFRLSTHVVEVPPLDERFEDVVAYLRSRSLATGQSMLEALSPGAIELLKEHHWEGNFRELINFYERVAPLGERGTIDAGATRRALEEGALPRAAERSHPSPALRHVDDGTWATLAGPAAAAFAEDHGTQAPRTWDEVKTFVESYLKPLLLAHLTGCDKIARREDVDLRAVAQRLNADRGTAAKQVARYFDRFGE
jgi:DNA-binding NtrC family response regulator